jgi:hypothetical protein
VKFEAQLELNELATCARLHVVGLDPPVPATVQLTVPCGNPLFGGGCVLVTVAVHDVDCPTTRDPDAHATVMEVLSFGASVNVFCAWIPERLPAAVK